MALVVRGVNRFRHPENGEKQIPPSLVPMDSIRVGDFYIFTNESGELFIEPIGSKEQYRCARKDGKLHISAHTVTFAPYGANCPGFLVSGK